MQSTKHATLKQIFLKYVYMVCCDLPEVLQSQRRMHFSFRLKFAFLKRLLCLVWQNIGVKGTRET